MEETPFNPIRITEEMPWEKNPDTAPRGAVIMRWPDRPTKIYIVIPIVSGTDAFYDSPKWIGCN